MGGKVQKQIPRNLIVSLAALFGLMIAVPGSVSCETTFYDTGTDSVAISVCESKIIIQLDTAQVGEPTGLLSRMPCITLDSIEPFPNGFLAFAIADTCTYESVIASLESDTAVTRIVPAYYDSDSSCIFQTDLVIVVFELELTLDSCQALLDDSQLHFVDSPMFMHNWWLCALDDTTSHEAVEAGNYISGLPGVEFAVANFSGEIVAAYADPLLPHQYSIDQPSSSVDLNVRRAHAYLPQAESIRVAIIDDGFDPHPDIPSWRLSPGWSMRRESSDYGAVPGAGHGMACLGALAASKDTIGVVGVIPTASIIPVQLWESDQDYDPTTTDAKFSGAINFAVNAGARVISISVGSLSHKPATAEAIRMASLPNSALGRDYGCIVVCAAGNSGVDPLKNKIIFPATLDEVIAVGAVDRVGARASYSSYGPALDIMAFGGAVINESAPGVCNGDIWTTDGVQELGYNPYSACDGYEQSTDVNYISGFGGTSVATPQVAGVAAMLLSYRSDIDHVQVRDVLVASAIDIMPEGRDDQSGYGRVDAMRAMACVARGDLTGDGDINILDVTRVVNVAFRGAPCVHFHPSLADINCDGVYNVQDVVLVANVAFRNGARPEIRTDCLDIVVGYSACCLAPSAPTLRLPADEAVGLSTEIEFDWWNEHAATGYFIVISDEPDFSNQLYADAVTATELTLSGFEPGATIYWKVRAANTCNTGPFSDSWSFTVDTEP